MPAPPARRRERPRKRSHCTTENLVVSQPRPSVIRIFQTEPTMQYSLRNLLPLVSCLALTGIASAAQQPGKMLSDKDTWACEVAMCLSNPSGPTAVAECRPPIEKMQREIAKGNAIPKCPFVQNNSQSGDGSSSGGGDDRTAQQVR